MGSFLRKKQAQALDADIVLDAKAVVKALNQVEPGLRKEMVREMKKISRPMEKDIRSLIPSTSPFGSQGHSEGRGRLSWDYGTYKKGGARVAPEVLAQVGLEVLGQLTACSKCGFVTLWLL